jgi:hypothetical protein
MLKVPLFVEKIKKFFAPFLNSAVVFGGLKVHFSEIILKKVF